MKGVKRGLESYALVFLVTLHEVASPCRLVTILFTFQVALNRVVRDEEAIPVLDKLHSTFDMCPLKGSGSAFFYLYVSVYHRPADLDRRSLLCLDAAFHVDAACNQGCIVLNLDCALDAPSRKSTGSPWRHQEIIRR